MTAIMRREWSAYFTAPLGYVYLGAFYFFAGYFFFTGVLLPNRTDLTPVFSGMINLIMVLTPLLTMRLMSEERRLRTDQALLTAPVTLGAIIGGKFLAALAVYGAGIGVIPLFALILHSFTPLYWTIIWGGFLALLLLGAAFIALGLCISALTESQVIAAVGSFSAMLGLFLLDALPLRIPNPLLGEILSGLSFIRRYTPFTRGILGPANIFFFISFTGLFLFLAGRIWEKRRWS